MDINENEEHIEELEPLADTAELAVDPVEDNQAPATEEPVILADLDPLVEEEEDLENSADAEVSEQLLEEQPQDDVVPDLEPADDQETELDESDQPLLEEETVPAKIDSDEDETFGIPEEFGSTVEKAPEQDVVDPYRKRMLEIEPAVDDGRAWYVVHCYSGNEDKVRHNILQRIESMTMDDLIFDVVVPTEDEVNIKNGERQTVEKKVFPGYILVNMILTEESWYMVRNTPGVTGFVGMGNDPTALQPEEVARILKRMESESPRINVTFRPGERVRIVDGPFEDFYGKVSEIDMDRATVRVMVNFFGRETPVELDFLQVEEA